MYLITVNVLPEPEILIPQLIATGILFLVLRHFLFGPISERLKARSQSIVDDIDSAKSQREEVEVIKKDYELKLSEAKEEARDIVEGAKKRGDQLKDEIVVEAKNEASNILEKARTDMEREKEKVLDDLKSEVVDIAMLAASKVIEKDLDKNTHKNMINKFIDEVGETKWKN